MKNNKDELRAKRYLQKLNFTHVIYEPLGNVTPDFLLDKRVAVEVRRLNRNYINADQLLHVENTEILIVKKIKKIICAYQDNAYTNSASVSLQFIKTLDTHSIRNIIKKVKKTLKQHMLHITKQKNYIISKSLEITFSPIKKESNIYSYSSCNGQNLWLVNELHKHIQVVIDEKNKKIEKNFHLYNEWWLLLVDSIIYGLDAEDFEELKKVQPNKQRFSKIIVLSAKGEFKTIEF